MQRAALRRKLFLLRVFNGGRFDVRWTPDGRSEEQSSGFWEIIEMSQSPQTVLEVI